MAAAPPPRWALLLLPALVASALNAAERRIPAPADSQCLIQVQLQAASRSAAGEQVPSASAEPPGVGSSRYYETLSVVGAAQAVLAAVPKAELAALPPAASAALDRGLLEAQDRLEVLLLLLPPGARALALRQAGQDAAAAAAGHPSQGSEPWAIPAEQCCASWGEPASALNPHCARRLYGPLLQSQAPGELLSRSAGLDALVQRLARREDSASGAGPARDAEAGRGARPPRPQGNRTSSSAKHSDSGGASARDPFKAGVPPQASFVAQPPPPPPSTPEGGEVQRPPERKRWLFLANLVLVLAAFVIIILVIVFASPIRGAADMLRNRQGNLQVRGRSSNKFIQVCLPFWLPVERDTEGWLWLWLFAASCVTAISVGWLWAVGIVKLALACDPTVFDSVGGAGARVGLFRSQRLVALCAVGLFALPVNYGLFYRKMKGREPQWCLLLLQLFLMFQATFSGFVGTFLERNVTNWMIELKPDAYWHWQRTYIPITMVITIVFTVLTILNSLILRWKWKTFMTNYVLDRYMANRAYYHLNSNASQEDGTDNPDSRICADVPAAVDEITAFIFSMLGLVQGLISSMLIVWATVPYWTMVAVLYCTAGSGLSMWFAWQFLRLNYEIEKKAADFRFCLFNVRSMAEPIALFGGEKAERARIDNRFQGFQEFVLRSIWWNMGFGLFEHLYMTGLSIGPQIVLTRKYFQGHLDFGGIGQVINAFGALSMHLNYLHTHTHQLANLGNSITRLAGLLRRIEETEEQSRMKVVFTDHLRLELCDVTVRTPMGARELVSGLSLSVGGDSGVQRLLVCGRSGVGKSSLLRGIAGLWLNGSGHILRPGDDDCMFLPQQPYMPIGNLRDQFRYPERPELADPWDCGGAEPAEDSELEKSRRARDQELMPLLEDLGLGDLPGRFEDGFDQNEDWKRFLSTGEQQRVAIIRCMLKHPKLALLDECTSALSELDEALVYRRMMQLNMSYVSVGHRRSLLAFHDRVLLISSSTEHQLLTAEEYLAMQQDLNNLDNTMPLENGGFAAL